MAIIVEFEVGILVGVLAFRVVCNCEVELFVAGLLDKLLSEVVAVSLVAS